MKFDLDLFPEEKENKWVYPCDKCGQFTSHKSGGICFKESEVGDSWYSYIIGAQCKKCKGKK